MAEGRAPANELDERALMNSILVTGSPGMLGSCLVPYLRSRGNEVVELSRTGQSSVHADLSDSGQVCAALDRIVPRSIVNLAALADVDACQRTPQRAYVANVRIVENLAAWIDARGKGCQLVHISTDQVYDGAGPHREDDVTLTNYYGFSKYAGELAAARVGATVLRTNFFGPSQCAGRASLSDWLVKSLTARDAVTVFDDILFSPLVLRTLVEQIDRVIREPRAGVFNLGSKQGMTKADFAFALAQILDLPTASISRGNSESRKLTAYRPKDMRMDSTRFEQAYSVQLPTLREELHSLRAGHAHEAP